MENMQIEVQNIAPQKVAQPLRAAAWAYVKVNGSIVGEMTHTYLRKDKKYLNETCYWFKPYDYTGARSSLLTSGPTAQAAVRNYYATCGKTCGNCGKA
jgi:hypothetical protein